MDYLIDTIFPARQVHIFAGSSGAGKSSLLLQLCRDFLEGKPWFGHKTHPASFAYIACDRTWEEYQDKMVLMKLTGFEVQSLVSNTFFDPSRFGREPKSAIDFLKGMHQNFGSPRFMVIDPLSPFLPRELNSYHDVASSLIGLTRFCLKESVTIIGTHHATKLRDETKFKRPQDRILGSAALQGYSGTHCFLTSPQEVYHRHQEVEASILTLVPHNSHPEEHHLLRDNITGLFVPFIPEDEYNENSKVLDLMPKPPDSMSSQALVELIEANIDVSRATAFRRIAKLVEAGKLERLESGWYRRRPTSLRVV